MLLIYILELQDLEWVDLNFFGRFSCILILVLKPSWEWPIQFGVDQILKNVVSKWLAYNLKCVWQRDRSFVNDLLV